MSQEEPRVIPSAAPKPRQRRPKREEVRDRLIEGAMHAFALKGFGGASIDFICAQAGFSRGAFYSNFDDKEALFFALYDQRIDRLYTRLGRIAEVVQASDQPWQTIADHLRDPDPDELQWDILNKEFILHALRNEAAQQRLRASRQGSKERLSEILISLEANLADHPEQLDQLCRFIIALHEGELTQLGLDPALTVQTSLLARFVPLVMSGMVEAL